MMTFGKRAAGARLERMRASPLWHKSGEDERGKNAKCSGGFRNVHPVLPGLKDPEAKFPSLREFVCVDGRRVPEGPLPSASPLDAWTTPAGSGLRATWLGHSTVLIEIDGFRVLTDPVWGPRASPLRMAGPKRFQPVPVPIKALPPLDAVLVSHDHYDHLDYPSIRELTKRQPGVPFVTSLGVGAHLEAWGVPPERIVELDWWQQHTLQSPSLQHQHKAELRIHAAPSQHFSGRGLKDRNATLWSSLVVESARHRVFFSGDTGLTTEYAAIKDRYGPFDLVMLEVGAFHPAWGDIHLGPANALKALQLLGGGAFLPVHWGTFSLAMHDWDEPAETLLALGPKQGARLLMPRLGEAVEPGRGAMVGPWWRSAGEVPQRTGTSPQAEPDLQTAPKAMPWPLD